MRRLQLFAILVAMAFVACEKDDNSPSALLTDSMARQVERQAWYNANPESEEADVVVESESHKLEFFGWGEDKDKIFTLNFPTEAKSFRRAILEYQMGGWNKGPAAYDNTTMLFIKNKADDEWYEIARAFTPYGEGFTSAWKKSFYIDVTPYIPMLEGDTEFRLYYGGFDANDQRAHTLTLTFNLYEGEPEREMVYVAKVYDSSRNGNSGYRGYAYGVEGHDIEADERMGKRSFEIPAEVKELEMKVAISGHGHDLGNFPYRQGYVRQNAAEFVENTYQIFVDNKPQRRMGRIFYSNADNYEQTGTYWYDRANWAPGNPLYVHYWSINRGSNPPQTMTLNLNLETFISTMDQTNAEGVAQYIVEVDLFGYK